MKTETEKADDGRSSPASGSPREEIDHDYTDNPVCPCCGREVRYAWELSDSDSRECENCDAEFEIERIVSYTYITRLKENDKVSGRAAQKGEHE